MSKIAGAEHVAIGADLGGRIRAAKPVSSAGDMPSLLSKLACLGLDTHELENLAYRNFLRFWRDAWDDYRQIPPLDWRPLRARSLSDNPEDDALFDRLSSTGRLVCGPGNEGWRFIVTMESQRMPDLIAVRVRAASGGLGAVSVEVTDPKIGTRYGGGACSPDGSRCLISLSHGQATQQPQSISVSLLPITTDEVCLEVLDLVPILSVQTQPAEEDGAVHL